jgi:two-component system response regulator FixJ
MVAGGARQVYVIDDDPDVLRSTAFLLPTLGYECRTFAAPEQFLELAATLAPGCVLTDLRMPAMDGFQLTRRIRNSGLRWPVLMMTTDDGPALTRRATEDGLHALLRKPLDADLLAAALDEAFAALDA